MSEQTKLPFEPITDVATRDTARATLKRFGEIFKIDINKVKFRPGIQPRYKPEWMDYDTWFNKELAIPELAELIAARGQDEPIVGDLTSDGTFYATKGHRRTMAMQWLIANEPEKAEQFKEEFKGETFYMIKVIRNPADMTDLQRLIKTTTEEEQLQLKPLELAYRVLQVKQSKEGGGEYSNDELKNIYGKKSRQWVDNQINLATLPEDIRIQIEKGEISPTQALAIKREEKKVEKEKKRSVPADKEDEDGYIITKGAKAGIEDISKSFLGAAHWDDERRKVMNHVGIADFDHFTDWNHAFVRGVKLINSEYQTSIKDYINDFKVWFGDQNAEAPTELHKEGNDTPFDDAKDRAEAPTETAAEGNHDEMGRIPGQPGYGEPPAIHDTTSIEKQDDGLQKGTDPNFKDPRPQKDRDGDALGDIDFKKEKTEAEMDLNEAIKMGDKLYTQLGSLPEGMKQFKDDTQRLVHFMQGKMQNAIAIIKKAADVR